MSARFTLLLISAMYENGGNTTQRYLDGHPELFAYPFESQLGTRYVCDHLTGLYPVKYRWPEFPLDGTPTDDYERIIDEECKVRLKTPQASKFRDAELALCDAERKRLFLRYLEGQPRTRARLVEAFFRASADAWKDYRRSGREKVYVGYSPIVGVDTDKVLADVPDAHVLNVVRNPWSAYADTKRRPVPLDLAHYLTGWCVHLQHALAFQDKYPGRVHVLRYEDLVEAPGRILGTILARLEVETSPALDRPSWNGRPLPQVYPWGTIRTPTPEANRAAAAELSPAERDEIRRWTRPLVEQMGYAEA